MSNVDNGFVIEEGTVDNGFNVVVDEASSVDNGFVIETPAPVKQEESFVDKSIDSVLDFSDKMTTPITYADAPAVQQGTNKLKFDLNDPVPIIGRTEEYNTIATKLPHEKSMFELIEREQAGLSDSANMDEYKEFRDLSKDEQIRNVIPRNLGFGMIGEAFYEPGETEQAYEQRLQNTPVIERRRLAQAKEDDLLRQGQRAVSQDIHKTTVGADLKNVAQGMGTRAFDLAGNLAIAADIVLRHQDVNPRAKNQDMPKFEGWESPIRKTGEFLKDSGDDLGYEEGTNWEDVKFSARNKGLVNPQTYIDIAAYGFEQTVKSIPDMIAALYVMPSYVVARTAEIGEERAKNDGRDRADLSDMRAAAPAALASALFERIGAKGITKAAKARIGKEMMEAGFSFVAKQGLKGATVESSTEFFQEGVLEYIGEKWGTEAKMSLSEMFDRGAGGALAGGLGGGTISSAGASVNVLNAKQGKKGARTEEIQGRQAEVDAKNIAEFNKEAERQAKDKPTIKISEEPLKKGEFRKLYLDGPVAKFTAKKKADDINRQFDLSEDATETEFYINDAFAEDAIQEIRDLNDLISSGSLTDAEINDELSKITGVETNPSDATKDSLSNEISQLESKQSSITEDNSIRLNIINNLEKINSESLPSNLKKGIKGDIPIAWLSKEGVSIDEAAHKAWENLPDNMREQYNTLDVKNIIEEVIQSNKKDALNEAMGDPQKIKDLKKAQRDTNKKQPAKEVEKDGVTLDIIENQNKGNSIELKNNGKTVGTIDTLIDGDDAMIFTVEITDKKLRKKGHGRSLYKKALILAKGQGAKKAKSSNQVSLDASRIWEQLGAKKNPLTKEEKSDGIISLVVPPYQSVYSMPINEAISNLSINTNQKPTSEAVKSKADQGAPTTLTGEQTQERKRIDERDTRLVKVRSNVNDVADLIRGGKDLKAKPAHMKKINFELTKAMELDKVDTIKQLQKLDDELQDVGGLLKVVGARSKAGKIFSEVKKEVEFYEGKKPSEKATIPKIEKTPVMSKEVIAQKVKGTDEGYKINKNGGKIEFFTGYRDFPGEKSEQNTGEIFYVETQEAYAKKGVATGLMKDALHHMYKNGARKVIIHPLNDISRKLNNRLIDDGYLVFLREADNGKQEYKINIAKKSPTKLDAKPVAEAKPTADDTQIFKSQLPKTETKQFKKWFGDSKVVDKDGQPKVVFHGTDKEVDAFDLDKYETIQKGDWGKGVYFTPRRWPAMEYAETAVKEKDDNLKKMWSTLESKAAKYGTDIMMMDIDLSNDKIKLDELKSLKREINKYTDSLDKDGHITVAYLTLKNPMNYIYQGITDPQLEKEAKAKGHDGLLIFPRDYDGDFNVSDAEEILVFEPTQIKSTENRGTFDAQDPNIFKAKHPSIKSKDKKESTQQYVQKPYGKEEAKRNDKKINPGEGVQASMQAVNDDAPGKNHQPMFKTIGMPDRPESGSINVAGKDTQLESVDNPTRREGVITLVKGIIGPRLYDRQIKGKAMLGFYNGRNSEVRLKDYDDVEVLAHEMAHYLDFHKKNKRFQDAYMNDSKVHGLSYTSSATENGLGFETYKSEGFAEYVRLWLTQYDEASTRAPEFTKEFESILKQDKKLNRDMIKLRTEMHKYFRQGDLSHVYNATSGNILTAHERRILKQNRRGVELQRQRFLDKNHAAKVIIRETGFYGDASNNAYKQLQLLNGVEGIVALSYDHGALSIDEAGVLTTKGPSLKDVWGKSVNAGAKRIKAQEAYFASRRARELKKQNRENRFSWGMIKEGLALANKHPYFKQAFKDHQAYHNNMMEFYVDAGYLERSTVDAIQKRNKEWVPFNRVSDGVADSYSGTGANIMELRGGQQNIKPIYDNILKLNSRHIYAALKARAMRTLYTEARASQESSKFFSEISTAAKAEKINLNDMIEKVSNVMAELGATVDKEGLNEGSGNRFDDVDIAKNKEALKDYFKDNEDELVFWSFGHKPHTTETEVDSYINEKTGERVWIEIQKDNELLIDMISSMDGVPLTSSEVNKLIKLAFAAKNLLTVAITSMPQFFLGNIARDQQQAFTKTGGKYKPLIDIPSGFVEVLMNKLNASPIYKEMVLQGGPGGGRIRQVLSESYGLTSNQEHYRTHHWSHPAEWGHNIMETFMSISDAFEMSTRVSYYKKLRKQGVSPQEAAFQAREITTDFAKRGSDPVFTLALRTVPFANAYLQSVDNEILTILEEGGESKLRNALKFTPLRMKVYGAGMAIISMMSAIALMGNEEDKEKYQDLTEDQKARFYNFWVEDKHYTIPKPHGIWSVFGTIGESIVDLVYGQDKGDIAKTIAFSTAYNFGMDFTPGITKPMFEIAANEKFTGAPIVPKALEGASPSEQYTNRTGLAYVEASKFIKDKFNVEISPVKAEHLMKGYTGYVEQIMSESFNKMIWDKKEWGERPNQINAIKLFAKNFIPQYERSKYIEKYYDLKDKIKEAESDYRLAIKRVNRTGMDKIEETASNIFANIGASTKQVDSGISELSKIIDDTYFNKGMSAAEKEKLMNDAYNEKAKLVKQVYIELNKELKRIERVNKSIETEK